MPASFHGGPRYLFEKQ